MNMNTDEKINVCWKGNAMLGNQKDNQVKEGKGTKLSCSFTVGSENSCPPVGADTQKFMQDVKSTAGVVGGWCSV